MMLMKLNAQQLRKVNTKTKHWVTSTVVVLHLKNGKKIKLSKDFKTMVMPELLQQGRSFQKLKMLNLNFTKLFN